MKADAALLAALYSLALFLRLVPLTFSPLPFNIDGFPLARIAQGMASTGSWQIDPADVNAYNLKLPAYSLLWSAFAQLGGLHVLTDLQWAQAIVTATAVLSGYLLGVKATRHRGVGLAAGLFLAVFGSFLFLTSAVMKQSLGLVILPMAVLTYHDRSDPRRRAIALVLLLVLPFLHHLTALLALGMVSALLALHHRRAFARGEFRGRGLGWDLATGPLAAGAGWAYYDAVDMPFFRDLTRPGDLALFAVVALLVGTLLLRTWRPSRVRAGRRLVTPASRVVLVPAIAFGGLLLNARTSVFAGTVGTMPALYPVLLACAVLAAFFLVGYEIVRRTSNRANDIVLALLAAPAALILFAFLRGLDPLSHAVVYRAFDFMDFGFAILGGVGLALAWRKTSMRRPFQVGVVALFLAALVATTPVAWNSQAVFGVENVTTPEEFQALAVLASLGARNMTSDQRLASVSAWWFGVPGDASLAVHLRDGEPPGPFEYAVVLERWTTVGAQLHPAPNVQLAPDVLASFLGAHPLVYVGGLPGDRIFVTRLSGPGDGVST